MNLKSKPYLVQPMTSTGFSGILYHRKKEAPKKVANMVATFLNKGHDGYQEIKVEAAQAEPKKVTNTVGTFLDEGKNDENQIIYEI